MNSENSKTSDPNFFVLNFADKKLKITDNHLALSNFSIYYTRENIKKWYKNNKFKIWNDKFQHEIINVNYLMNHILF